MWSKLCIRGSRIAIPHDSQTCGRSAHTWANNSRSPVLHGFLAFTGLGMLGIAQIAVLLEIFDMEAVELPRCRMLLLILVANSEW